MPKKLKKSKKAAKKRAVSKKKTAPKKKQAKKKQAKQKPLGKVTHFYNQINVAIVKFNKKVSAGSKLHYKGATTDFVDTAKSMQFNHASVATAPKGKQIGIKVKKRVRDGDLVYLAE